MTILAHIPGFRSNPALLAAYHGFANERTRIQRTALQTSRNQQRDQLLACQGKREYWDFIRSVRGKKVRFNVDPNAVETHFRRLLRTDGLLPPPMLFPYAPDEAVPDLDDPIDPDEVRRALKKMKSSADGEDRISVSALRRLDVDEIALFFHEISVTGDGKLPTTWTRSVLIPIPKVPGQQLLNPKLLRGLSIQTAIRRLYSRCLVPRLTSWLNGAGLLPSSQSGFRKGFRTTDNLAILRALHEQHLTSRRSLFIAFIDIEKAFDNVNRSKLWQLIYSYGGKGALVDTLHKLYADTTTSLQLHGRYSSLFPVDKGVLQGDPLSPILFILYIAGLSISEPDDPLLAGLPISDSLLADDLMIPSTSSTGLQRKLDRMNAFFASIDMKVNARKSKVLRLGFITNEAVDFRVNGETLEEVKEFKFIGFNVIGGKNAKWQNSVYIDKCIHKARAVATSLLQLRRHLGPSNADFMMRLWSNLADPYFVFAAEVSLDVSKVQEILMDQVLLQFMRSAMGLPPKSIRILPLLDNAIFEVRHRRLELAARFVEYAWGCADDRPVHCALLNSMDLFRTNSFRHGWYGGFASRVVALGVDPTPRRGLARDVRKAIIKLMNSEWDLLRSSASRIEIHRLIPTYLWHPKKLPYLRILSYTACRAIARLRTSSHNLMIERGRHSRIPRHQRLCPAGSRPIVETEHHAINCCADHDAVRSVFHQELFLLDPSLAGHTEKNLLGLILNPKKEWASVVGRFFRGVLDKVDARYLLHN